MAYGLSHELNNPLANIAGRARWLAELESDPEKRQQLSIIVDQAMRGCEMIADLMLFARPPAWVEADVDLAALMEQLCQRARIAPQPRPVDITLDIEPLVRDSRLRADPAALSEALWAVLRNALEAAQDAIAVRLTISGDRVIIQIADDGLGLSPQALEAAFHPFFSGREAGRGIGLGLSKAQRIVSLCHGEINLRNGEHGGCEVTISMPL